MDAASLPRILGAVIYDFIIVCAIIFIAAQWFPLVPEPYQDVLALVLFKQVYVLGICFIYFAYSWQRGGQTIGMKSWRIQLHSSDPQRTVVGWRQSAIRYLVAIISWLTLGMGYLWILFNPQRKSWHDIASGTHLIVLPKT